MQTSTFEKNGVMDKRKMPRRHPNPQEKAHKTREKTYRRIREAILLVDCTSKLKERCSETEFLQKYFAIINHQLRFEKRKLVQVVHHRRYSPKSLKNSLKWTYPFTMHISAHGSVSRKGETFLKLRYGKLYAKDVEGLWEEFPQKERPLILILAACCAGHKDLIKAFSKNGCRYVIAPLNPTAWESAALFSIFFYTNLFIRRMRPVPAFCRATRNIPDLDGGWKMFDFGTEVSC
jgi:hypothetical protein